MCLLCRQLQNQIFSILVYSLSPEFPTGGVTAIEAHLAFQGDLPYNRRIFDF